jgi:hypothetical protein
LIFIVSSFAGMDIFDLQSPCLSREISGVNDLRALCHDAWRRSVALGRQNFAIS